LAAVLLVVRPPRVQDAIRRHIEWAEQFMVVGDFVGVTEELGDAMALAAEMVAERPPVGPVR
jgi:hypothetical protein